MLGINDSGFVASNGESVCGASETSDEVMLVAEVETAGPNAVRSGATEGLSTVAAAAVRPGIERLRIAGKVTARETRTSRAAAIAHLSFCLKDLFHQESLICWVAAGWAGEDADCVCRAKG